MDNVVLSQAEMILLSAFLQAANAEYLRIYHEAMVDESWAMAFDSAIEFARNYAGSKTFDDAILAGAYRIAHPTAYDAFYFSEAA